MNVKFFSMKDSEYQSSVKIQELKGTFTDRVIDRLNRAYNESKKQFDPPPQRIEVKRPAS